MTSPPKAHTIRLDRNRFIPSEIRARMGDTLKFVNGEGGPHNVEFDKDSIEPAERKVIEGAMGPDKILPLSGPIMMLNGQVYTFVVPDLPAGRYAYLCSPHWANMKGALIVER